MAEEIEIPLASTDKYEEALAKARFEYKENPCASESEKRLLEIIFPELRESEDEKIRKWIVGWVESIVWRKDLEVSKETVIAWLEKMKVNPFSGEGLEKAAEEYASHVDMGTCGELVIPAFIAGAKWQEKQDQETIELAEDHAMLAGRMQMKEEMEKIMESDPDAIEKTPKQDYSGLNDFERAIHRGFLCAGVENVPVSIIKQTAEEAGQEIKLVDCDSFAFEWGFKMGKEQALEEQKPAEWGEEDEKIRESLLRHFKNKTKPYWNGIAVKDIIAYLEKLKDVETEIEKAYKNADAIQYEKGFEDGVASVKSYMKLKEHDMPSSTELIAKWNEEKKILQEKYEPGHPWRLAYNAFMDGFGYGFHVKQKEQKPAEIDEYEIIKKHITEDSLSSEVNKRLKECGWYVTDEKPAEWSEEDEKMIDDITVFVSGYADKRVVSDWVAFLKSLHPQPHWKPSAEQMDALIDAKTRMSCDGGFPAILQTLIEDLKEL